MKISNQIRKQLQVTAIEKIKATLMTQGEKSFRASIELGHLFSQALAWYNEGGKEVLKADNEGENVNVDVFCIEVLKNSKSWVYRCIKASSVANDTIEKFIEAVKLLNKQGQSVEMSIGNLNKFVKDNESIVEVEKPTEGEGEGEGEGTTEAKGNTIFTLSWKRDGHNVALRVDDNGQFVTNNAPEQLAEAIEFLQGVLAELTANMEA